MTILLTYYIYNTFFLYYIASAEASYLLLFKYFNFIRLYNTIFYSYCVYLHLAINGKRSDLFTWINMRYATHIAYSNIPFLVSKSIPLLVGVLELSF